MKPPFPYYGAKQIIADRIASLFPPHTHYVEPFAGSLAVLLAKTPSKMETVNDLDGHLVTFWRVLRERPAELEQACALTPHARAEYAATWPLDAPDDLEVARRVWTQLVQGRAGKFNKGWRTIIGAANGLSMPDYLSAYRSRLAAVAERLAKVTLECQPALDIITLYGRDPDVLIYADPPYLAEVRAGSGCYRLEMDRPQQHAELADALKACRAAVILSGYPSPLYDQLYGGWHRQNIPTQTAQGGAGKATVEALWSNRPLGVQPALFDLAGGAA